MQILSEGVRLSLSLPASQSSVTVFIIYNHFVVISHGICLRLQTKYALLDEDDISLVEQFAFEVSRLYSASCMKWLIFQLLSQCLL